MESVALRDSAPIEYEGKSHQTLDALKIARDTSIVLRNCDDITIECCELRSIDLIECQRISIRNCWIHDSTRCGVQVYHGHHIRVEGCRIEQVATGVYAIDSEGVGVDGNFVRNVVGPFPRGQLAQFDNVTGVGNSISGNYAINEKGHSHPEDVINVYMSRGEPTSPIKIEANYLLGDPALGSAGKSLSGSGIMLADQGGADQLCRNNVILSAGQVGIGVAGGTSIRVEGNRILGTRSEVSNAGLYAWNQSKAPSRDVSIEHNRVHWENKDGELNDWWNGGGVDALRQADNHFADATLAGSIPPPPSQAPLPPQPYISKGENDRAFIRLPWTP